MSLRVSQLTKDYPTRSGPLPVLCGVDLELDRGSALAVMGPSGSGKSTLLYILGTLDAPTAGKVDLGGTDPFALPERALAGFRNRHIGFVFQDHHLLPQCSVLENVLVPTLAGPSRTLCVACVLAGVVAVMMHLRAFGDLVSTLQRPRPRGNGQAFK